MVSHIVVQEGIKALSQFQLGIIVAILWIGIVVLILGVFWIKRKYPQKAEKLDPVYKGVFIILIIFLVHVTAVAIGVLTMESIQNNLKYYGAAIIIAIVFYSLVGWFRRHTIPGWKLYKDYVLPEVKRFLQGEPYKGKGYSDPITYHRVLEVSKSKYLKEQGVEGEKVQVFLGRAYFGNVFKYIAVANKHTGEVVMLHKNPPLSIQQELLGKDFVSSFEKPLEEFDTKAGDTEEEND